MKCPNCGFNNPDHILTCICGHNFYPSRGLPKTLEAKSSEEKNNDLSIKIKKVIPGLLGVLVILGTMIGIVTFSTHILGVKPKGFWILGILVLSVFAGGTVISLLDGTFQTEFAKFKNIKKWRESIYVTEFIIWAILCIPISINLIIDPSAEKGIWLLGLLAPYLAYLGFRHVANAGGKILIVITILPLIWLFIGDCVRLLAYQSLYRGKNDVYFFWFDLRKGKS